METTHTIDECMGWKQVSGLLSCEKGFLQHLVVVSEEVAKQLLCISKGMSKRVQLLPMDDFLLAEQPKQKMMQNILKNPP